MVYGASLVLSARTHVYADAAKIPENSPASDGIIDDENSGFTIKSIPNSNYHCCYLILPYLFM